MCLFAQIKDRKRIEQNQSSFCYCGHAPGVGLGVLGLKSFRVGICDGAPSNARSSNNIALLHVGLLTLSIPQHVPLLGHDNVHFLDDVAYNAVSTQLSIITS